MISFFLDKCTQNEIAMCGLVFIFNSTKSDVSDLVLFLCPKGGEFMKKTVKNRHLYSQVRSKKTRNISTNNNTDYTQHVFSGKVLPENQFAFSNLVDNRSFFAQIHSFAVFFKNYIELKAGYKLLWDDTKTISRREESVQILFKGILDSLCKANNIDFTREVNQGMGPVDFRFSCGYRNRVLLEIKLAQNTHFWNGLTKQLPQYMEVDSCQYGIFLVVVYTDKEMEQIKDIERICSETECEYGIELKVVIVDARPHTKKSASKQF